MAHPDGNVLDASTPLSIAVNNDDVARVQLLLAHPYINVNASNNKGNTPLIAAVLSGSTTITRLLMAHPDIDVNAANNKGDTPLIIAVLIGNIMITQLLLAAPGINVNATNKEGHNTPLITAVLLCNAEITQLLVAHPDINVNVTNLNHVFIFTPLFLAVNKGNDMCVELLLKHPDIDVNWQLAESIMRSDKLTSKLLHVVLLLASRRIYTDVIATSIRNIGQQAFGNEWQSICQLIKSETKGHRRWCAHCYDVTAELKPFSLCGGCQQVGYCSIDHQRAHWATHKQVCTWRRTSASTM